MYASYNNIIFSRIETFGLLTLQTIVALIGICRLYRWIGSVDNPAVLDHVLWK